jgi:hypothetical protein
LDLLRNVFFEFELEKLQKTSKIAFQSFYPREKMEKRDRKERQRVGREKFVSNTLVYKCSEPNIDDL